MESYLDKTSLSKATKSERKKQKVKAAWKIINSWGEGKKLTEFKPALEGEIEKLYAFIEWWNGIEPK
jgi:hypothetical protein